VRKNAIFAGKMAFRAPTIICILLNISNLQENAHFRKFIRLVFAFRVG